MRKIKWNSVKTYIAVFVFLIAIGIAVQQPVSVHAADQPVKVNSCKLNAKGKKITVKAKVKQKTSAMGSKLYLLSLNANKSETGTVSASPLASVGAKKGTVTFKVNYKSSMLYQKFVVAYKSGKNYKIVSDARYITNPETLATFTGKGPTASSKKGLQVEELSDSLEIGTQHAVVNWTLNSLLNDKAANKTSFTYKNKTYYLDADQLARNDELVQAYNAAGVRVTVILLLPKDSASSGTAAMQFGGYTYTLFSSFKTSTKAGCQTFEAIMTYLAKRYGTKENLVSGWILGNEVNSACIWNYGGNKSLSNYMANYARAFRICYNAVKSVSKNAKVYISLDNNWNNDADGSGKRYFSSKAVLDAFYAQLKAQGVISFQIAYHAYPQGMSDPIFWDDTNAINSVKSKIVNFKNISVLTNYAKKNFGKSCTVMLSEQSFNSSRGEAIQAAAYAYAYYISEGNSMIEAFIYGREFDHKDEMNQGYRWGLCDEWHTKRLIWHVFQYIDSKESFTFTDPLLSYTNLKKWNKISGFKKTICTKMPSKLMKGTITGIEPASSTSLTLTWDKMSTGDGYEIYRNGSLIKTIAGNSTVTYTDTGLVSGTAYQYQVRMYKEAPKAGNVNKRVNLYGALSNAVTATAAPAQVVLNETNCSVDGNKIKIAWKKMTDVTGYEIYRSTAENGAYTLVGTAEGTSNSYTDGDTVSGTTYYYKVRAYITVNGVNYYGKDSDTTAQLSLIQVTASIVDGKVVLNWTPWPGAVKYRVLVSPQNEENFVRIKVVNDLTYTASNYTDTSGNQFEFTLGSTYYFRIRAVMSDGTTSKFSNHVPLIISQPIDNTGIITEEEQIETEIEEMEVIEADTEAEEAEMTEMESTETESTETESEEWDMTETESEETEPEDTEASEIEMFDLESTEAEEPETMKLE